MQGKRLDADEAHLMFPATPETVLAAGGGIRGRLATRSALAGPPSLRSGVRADARLIPALLAGSPSALEPDVFRVLG